MFFGPSHGFPHYSSLPRRSAASAFQRNTPIRRSTGIPEHHLANYVPRSISEFNLSGVGDLALPPPRRCSPTFPNSFGLGVAHGLQLGPPPPPQAFHCAPPPPPPPQPQQQQQQQPLNVMKPREKMVTFEDESKALAAVASNVAGGPAAHCPHGISTTPRKSARILSGAGGVGGTGSDVFM